MLLWETLRINAVGLTRIPLVLFVGPRVLRFDGTTHELVVPLNRRTRNHTGSMYFGALAIGADLTCGFPAWDLARTQFPGVVPLLKEARAEFLRRADGDVHFTSHAVAQTRAAVARVHATGEKVEFPVEVVATVPSRSGDEPVARFTLLLSLRRSRSAP